jgi:subfamily B ATP-binding cassette protein MsbA
MGNIIDTHGEITALIAVALSIIIFSFFSNMFRYLGLYFMAPIRAGFIKNLRKDIYKQMLILPLSYYAKERKGDIMNRIGSDVQEVEWSIVSMLQMLFRDPLLIVVYCGSLLLISPELTLIAVVLLPISGYIIAFLGKKIKRNSIKAQAILGHLSSIFEETIGGLRIIKGYNAIDHASEKFRESNHYFYKLSKKIYIRTELGGPVVELMAILTLMVVLYIGGSLVLGENTLNGELFVFYILIFARLIPPAKSLVSCYYNIQKGLASAKRIYAVIDGEERIIEVSNPISIQEFKDKIEYRNVTFFYQGGNEILKNINFSLQKGKNIALVGASGGGKSTLVDLLPRFYDATSGTILIDGIDSKLYKISELRNLFGVVNHDVILFNDTVYHNIAFGKKGISLEAVIAAAKVAKAHDFIMEMENGYDTIIGDRGMNMSGGERQRISIARALLKNPEVLILDEATSALDAESEYLVQQAIEELLDKRTAIVIAHRLSTIRHADLILFIDNGEIIESGKHQELMDQKGAYYKFCCIQEMTHL